LVIVVSFLLLVIVVSFFLLVIVVSFQWPEEGKTLQ
jgi:hypothetical protein